MKVLITVIINLLLVLNTVNAVNAQTNYEILLNNYRTSFDTYIEARDEYIEARAEYLKFKTLVAQTEAIKVTQNFLTTRQQVQINYLALIKERLEQSPELTDDELKEFILYINDETEFLNSQIPLFDTTNNLDDLVRLSDEAERKHETYLATSYKIKGLIVAGKVRSLRKTAEELINLATEQAARIRKEGLIETTDIDRWIIETPEKLVFAKSNETTGITELNELNPRDVIRQGPNAYGKLQKALRISNQYLREIDVLLLQIVQKIRFN